MKKKFSVLLGVISILFFSTATSLADTPTVMSNKPQVILDQLLTGPVPALSLKDLEIPSDLKPGFHELTVEVYNKQGVISSKTALFCKDLQGELHFNNNCPDLFPKPVPPKPIPFNPNENPDQTISFFAIAFAIAAALLGSRRREGESQGDLGGADAGSLGIPNVKKAWGDRRWYINTRKMTSLDSAPKSLSRGVEQISVLLARSINDARYLRAIFGNLAWLTIPATLYLSYTGMRSIKNHALPFDRNLILILALIGVFDAFAGLLAASVYLDFTFANGSLNSQSSIFFALGFALIFFAPGLLASKFRPLHRKVKDLPTFWERITDYILASLLTGWVASKLVGALTGLIGYQLAITKSANLIGILIGCGVLARLLVEELAWYLYPYRLALLHVDLRPAGNVQKIRGIIFKVGVMVILAQPYIGWNRFLAGGIAIFLVPQFLGFFSDKLPKFKFFAQITPGGVFKMVWMGIIGVIVATQISNQNLIPRDTILFAFVIMPLPSLAYSLMDAFASEPYLNIKDHKFRYLYRISGVFILILLILQILGYNPLTEIAKAWQNPTETWDSLTYKWWPYVMTGWNNVCHWSSLAWSQIVDWSDTAWTHISDWSVSTWHKVAG